MPLRPLASVFDLLDIPGPFRSYPSLSTVPFICAEYTGSGQECEDTMQAFTVTLGDCGSSWTLCRCTNADIGLEEAIDHLARVPVGLRRNVGTVMIMPDTSAHAYTLGGDIHFFGICSQRTWIHEVRCWIVRSFLGVHWTHHALCFSDSHSLLMPQIMGILLLTSGSMQLTVTRAFRIRTPKPTTSRCARFRVIIFRYHC